MNTRSAIDVSSSPISLSVAFNQDGSCFSVGLDSGFCGALSWVYIMLTVHRPRAKDEQSLTPNHVSSEYLEVSD